MVKENNKTADKQAYQNNYMKSYIANAESIDCPVCKAAGFSGRFKSYNAYKHNQSAKHKEAETILKAKGELEKREKDEAEALAKAQAEALAKPTPKPTPRPRKKATPPAPKSEALKALEDYGSSSDEEHEPEKNDLEKITFTLQSKKINSEEVAEFLKSHFETSVNPARKADSKTPRLNKNASLWRKVSADLNGKTFKELGQNFGKIVAAAYDKPTSQADFAQMLKQVILHFTKVPKPVEEKMKELIRSLKQKQVSKSTWLAENGATYENLKEHVDNENVSVALFSRIYDGEMPPMRISDWRNAVVGKTKTMNEIDLKKGIMIRRIKKNQKDDTRDIIPLPASLIKFIKDRGIKGEMFTGMSVTDIDNLIKKVYGEKKASPHYWRSYYTVHVLTKMESKAEIEEALRVMDHSLSTNAAYYNKQASTAYNNLVAGK